MSITQHSYNNSFTLSLNELCWKKEIIWMNLLTYRLRLKKDLWSKFHLGPKIRTFKDGHNPESPSKIKADPQSTVFSKSANPLDLPQKSTICVLFKAKTVDPKTYSPPPQPFRPILNPSTALLDIFCVEHALVRRHNSKFQRQIVHFLILAWNLAWW